MWLVKAMRRGRPVEEECNRKDTTWYENHAVRFRQSVQSESRVKPWIRSRSEALEVVSDNTACKLVQALAPPGSRKKIWGKKKSPLRVYVSSSISQTYNKLCAPFENKIRAIYFYKEVCFVYWSSFIIFDYVPGWLYENYTTPTLS